MTKTKSKERLLKTLRIKAAQSEKPIFALAGIAIISMALALFILIQELTTSNITGRVAGIGEGNVYGVIFIMIILLIASVAALVWFKRANN
jgi:hypothetical protein